MTKKSKVSIQEQKVLNIFVRLVFALVSSAILSDKILYIIVFKSVFA